MPYCVACVVHKESLGCLRRVTSNIKFAGPQYTWVRKHSESKLSYTRTQHNDASQVLYPHRLIWRETHPEAWGNEVIVPPEKTYSIWYLFIKKPWKDKLCTIISMWYLFLMIICSRVTLFVCELFSLVLSVSTLLLNNSSKILIQNIALNAHTESCTEPGATSELLGN